MDLAVLQVISSAVAALGRQAADVAATLAQLQPVQAALSTAFDLLQQLEQQLLAIGSASCHNSTAMRQPGSSLQANAAAGTNMSDVAVLQLEAEALRLQLQRRTLEVHELKDRQQQLLSGALESVVVISRAVHGIYHGADSLQRAQYMYACKIHQANAGAAC